MAFYSQDFLERVRGANDIVQVIESYNVQLKRAGSNMLGLCPFHNEKTPSFNVRTTEQFFRCFGCGAKGDVFRFVQMSERVEFPEAVRILSERAGIPLEYESPAMAGEAKKQGQLKSSLLWCCSRALDYFEERLAAGSGREGMEYLLSRGFTKETVNQWRLGWAPDSWDGLSGFLLKNAKDTPPKGKVLEYAAMAGLMRASQNDHGGGQQRFYDAFRGRVMFPIMDSQFRPIAFGGRLLKEDKERGGKYINSPEGRLFEKRRVLFGLAQASKEISLTGEVIVVEGYTDVIMCHQFGIRNVVATLGTALTDDHITLLGRYIRGKGRVIAFFDADSAGEKATMRAVEMFMRHDVPLAVARSLELKDACDFLPRFGADEFRKKLSQAEEGFSYLLRRTIGGVRAGDIAALGLAVKSVMAIVNICPDPVKLALMRRQVAVEAGVPEETLPEKDEGKHVRNPGRGRAAYTARPAAKKGLTMPFPGSVTGVDDALKRAGEARRRRELRLLRYMWESPEWCARIADVFPPDEWRDPAAAELAALARDEWDDERTPSINDIRSRVDHPGAVDILADLAFPDAEALSEKDLAGVLGIMADEDRQDKARELLRSLAEAERSGDDELQERLLVEYRELRRATGRK